jgi:PHS family inorganic phosphate transporter-like MFS transporter
MAETPRFTLHVEKDVTKFNNDMANMVNSDGMDHANIEKIDDEKKIVKESTNGTEDVPFMTFLRVYGYQLIGAAMSWCLLDVAFYSQNLFQKDVFLQIGWLPPAERMSALREAGQVSKAQALIALGSTIPGYWVTVFTVDILGRKNIQLMGFIMMTGFMAGLAGSYRHLLNPNTGGDRELDPNRGTKRDGWITMYAFCFFFANFGPNATTFIVPAELFPTKWKATGHGFSAGMGKAGAILGAFGFLFAAQPAKEETTWSYPCRYATDLSKNNGKTYCKRKANCPAGRQVPYYWTGVPTASTGYLTEWPSKVGAYDGAVCSACTPRLLSGCYYYGIGVPAALAILAATNFLGMLFTFMIPETMGKSLEELNGEAVKEDPEDALKTEMVGVPAIGTNQA